jgi:hypothetical protein
VALHRTPEKIVDTIAKDKERALFCGRLRDSLSKQGLALSPTRLAEEFNARFAGRSVGVHTCRKWLVGEAIPTQEKLVVLAAMLGIDPDWLRYGDRTQRKRVPHVASATAVPYARHELALIADYKQLHQRDQMLVRGLVGAMLKAGVV